MAPLGLALLTYGLKNPTHKHKDKKSSDAIESKRPGSVLQPSNKIHDRAQPLLIQFLAGNKKREKMKGR